MPTNQRRRKQVTAMNQVIRNLFQGRGVGSNGLIGIIFLCIPLIWSATVSSQDNSQDSSYPKVIIASPHQETATLQTHENLHSVLWLQTSSEFRALAIQAYAWARNMLDTALADKTWTAALEQEGDFAKLPPAIVLDIDETVLDNSTFQARLIKKNLSYSSKLWRQWCGEHKALAIPGAREFCQYAQSKGVKVFFVTNRDHYLEKDTRANLLQQGFPLEEKLDTVLCKGEKRAWSSDKASRRKEISNSYRILLLIGDNLGDFLSGVKVSPTDREAKMKPQEAWWGTRWIMIPNPMYGSWEESLYFFDYSLPDMQKLEHKLKNLRTN